MNAASKPDKTGPPERQVLERTEGTRFALHLYPAEAPAALAILIEPAMGVKAGYYGRLAGAFRTAGYNVAVAELRGHEEEGGRTPSRGYDFGYQEMLTEDWPQAVAAVKARWPSAALYLLGHSLGGQISMIYAAYHPDEVSGLILIACSSVHWRLWPAPFLPFSQFVVLVSRIMGYFPGHRFGFAAREARSVMADWGRQARTGRFRFGSPKEDHDRVLESLRLPVLGISFEGDLFAPEKAMDGLLAMIPHAELTRHHVDPKALGYDGIDHLRWARRPELVTPLVEDWLEKQAGH